MIRTKILATMGPAVRDADTLYEMFVAGADVCRLNFSHGSLDEHLQQLRMIREAAARHDTPVAVLGDLCGPKIRLGEVAEREDGGVPIAPGDTLTLQREPITATGHTVSCTEPDVLADVKVGHRVLVEDGLLRFECVEVVDVGIRCRCLGGGTLKSRKGINLPDSAVKMPSITERDWECVDWAVENELDFLALSFVRSADELLELKRYLRGRGSEIDLVAKIEKPEAVARFDAIVAASDAIMVARGDLGVEMDVAQVPIIQKDLIRRSQRAGKPVIVATQMLQSMIEQSTPTRAEVSDVANAVFDGADAVMLSGETSVGRYPVRVVDQMNRVCGEVDRYLDKHPQDVVAAPMQELSEEERLNGSLARSLRDFTRQLSPRAVVVYSQAGDTARLVSRHRLTVPVVALSADHAALRQMALHYGTLPIEMPPPARLRELVADADDLLKARGLVDDGDLILLVAGNDAGDPDSLNGVIVHRVGTTLRLESQTCDE